MAQVRKGWAAPPAAGRGAIGVPPRTVRTGSHRARSIPRTASSNSTAAEWGASRGRACENAAPLAQTPRHATEPMHQLPGGSCPTGLGVHASTRQRATIWYRFCEASQAQARSRRFRHQISLWANDLRKAPKHLTCMHRRRLTIGGRLRLSCRLRHGSPPPRWRARGQAGVLARVRLRRPEWCARGAIARLSELSARLQPTL